MSASSPSKRIPPTSETAMIHPRLLAGQAGMCVCVCVCVCVRVRVRVCVCVCT